MDFEELVVTLPSRAIPKTSRITVKPKAGQRVEVRVLTRHGSRTIARTQSHPVTFVADLVDDSGDESEVRRWRVVSPKVGA
jgi:hypothetical protein